MKACREGHYRFFGEFYPVNVSFPKHFINDSTISTLDNAPIQECMKWTMSQFDIYSCGCGQSQQREAILTRTLHRGSKSGLFVVIYPTIYFTISGDVGENITMCNSERTHGELGEQNTCCTQSASCGLLPFFSCANIYAFVFLHLATETNFHCFQFNFPASLFHTQMGLCQCQWPHF